MNKRRDIPDYEVHPDNPEELKYDEFEPIKLPKNMQSNNFFKRVKNFLEDTVRGDNAAGKTLNKLLPAKALRETIGAALTGAKDVIALPQIGDAKKEIKIGRIKKILKERKITRQDIKDLDPGTLQALAYSAVDLADDGRLNKSAEALSPEVRFYIRIGTSVIMIVYLLYGVYTGDWSLIEGIQFFFGS